MDITGRIEYFRAANKIRKADMARALDMDASHYSKLEQRGEKLTIEQLEKIAFALGVSVIELLTGEPQNDERVKELEKEVDLLTTNLNYYVKLESLYEERRGNRESQIQSYLHDVREFLAVQYEIGIAKYINKETGQITKVKVGESNSELDTEYFTFKYDREFLFTKDELATLNKLMFSDSDINWHIENLIKLGLIRDEGILYAYRQHLKSLYDEE
ncbi:hypothetical protein DR864_09200 [Runella rosea]|uniref:HTH cro/C1-type domain-containing protein n=1 Tax=Runella rosea TaxID=2259595 RepID=A0A344TGX3_9BACT|nr:helix-turn-helix transcriptional regulator [Runella rosea]AXE17894.1 hypothetical protein DR864_09200 [Runella rosea]